MTFKVGDRVRTRLGLAGVVVGFVDDPTFSRIWVQLDDSPGRTPVSYPPSLLEKEAAMSEPEAMTENRRLAEAETRERLRERAERGFPDAWIAKEAGDELAGVVVGIQPAVHTAYGSVPVVEVAELGVGTPWSVWLTHSVLRREFIRQRPAAGETILIRYLGKVTPDTGGASYELYRVVVDRPDEGNDVNWSGIAAKYEPDLAGRPGPFDDEPPDDGEDIPF